MNVLVTLQGGIGIKENRAAELFALLIGDIKHLAHIALTLIFPANHQHSHEYIRLFSFFQRVLIGLAAFFCKLYQLYHVTKAHCPDNCLYKLRYCPEAKAFLRAFECDECLVLLACAVEEACFQHCSGISAYVLLYVLLAFV